MKTAAIAELKRLPECKEPALSWQEKRDWHANARPVGSRTAGPLSTDVAERRPGDESPESFGRDYLLSYARGFKPLSAEQERVLGWRIWRARSELAETLGVMNAESSASSDPSGAAVSQTPLSSLVADRLLLAQEFAEHWVKRTEGESTTERSLIHAGIRGSQSSIKEWTDQRKAQHGQEKANTDIAIVQRCLGEIREAEETMVRHNLRLVFWVARRYAAKGFEMADVVQQGCLGLLHAARRFDPNRGTKFSTMATPWIIQSIQRGLANTARMIRVPVNRIGLLRRVSDSSEKLRSSLGRAPSADEVANELGLGAETVAALMAALGPVVSLDATVASTDRRFGDLIENRVRSPLDAAIEAERESNVEAALAVAALSSRERVIVAMRFGIGYDRGHTFQEIGALLGISRERVRQLLDDILERLWRVRSLGELHEGEIGTASPWGSCVRLSASGKQG